MHVHAHVPDAMMVASDFACSVQKMRIAWEEPFGPVVPVIRVKTIDEAIDHCNTNNLALQVVTRTCDVPHSFLRLPYGSGSHPRSCACALCRQAPCACLPNPRS